MPQVNADGLSFYTDGADADLLREELRLVSHGTRFFRINFYSKKSGEPRLQRLVSSLSCDGHPGWQVKISEKDTAYLQYIDLTEVGTATLRSARTDAEFRAIVSSNLGANNSGPAYHRRAKFDIKTLGRGVSRRARRPARYRD